MPLTTAALNQMLDALDEAPAAPSAGIAYLSLHTDVVGSGNTNEVSGGSPAYARQPAVWGAASGGTKSLTNQPTFDVPGGTTVRRLGFQSAASGGTYWGDADLTDETFAAQGTYTITSASITLT
jgi:hypothetical protein